MKQEIHKIIAITIKNNKLVMVRKKGKDIWTSLGGRIEKGETEEECLRREIKEEFNCDSKIINKIGDFYSKPVFDPDKELKLSAYRAELLGEIELIDDELEEYAFIGKDYSLKGIKLPPSMTEQIIPHLIENGFLKW